MVLLSPGRTRDKGKGRVTRTPSESDPLLPSSSSQHIPDRSYGGSTASRLLRILSILLVLLVSVLLALVLFVALVAGSFKPSQAEIDHLSSAAFAYSGPDNVQVYNVTSDGIYVNISLHCGIDLDSVLGIAGARKLDEASQARGNGAAWWESLRTWFARRTVDYLDARYVRVVPGNILIFPHHFDSIPLLTLFVLEPLHIPLVEDAHAAKSWLKPLSFAALVKPIATTGQLWDYIQSSWATGRVEVVIGASEVSAMLPGGWWTKYLQARMDDLVMDFSLAIPRLPGLPAPGHPLNMSSLVKLEDYSFASSEGALAIVAHASLPNPFNSTSAIPFGVPFTIGLADGKEMAQVVTKPFNLSTKVDLTMTGRVIADLSSSRESLSTFLQNYLHGLDNPITVRGLARVPSFARIETPPSWFLSTLPSLSLPLRFPGPRPAPKIIHSVTIEKMRLSERAGKMRASGTIIAEIELPEGMRSVEVNVVEVLPNVLVYNGPAGAEEANPEDPPPAAFGHINPDEFLDAETTASDTPHCLTVRAPMTDVALDVLAGRDSVLSDFVGKVVFKGGALAGVKGKASVRVEILGVQGRVTLDNLPVQGEFWVGRQR